MRAFCWRTWILPAVLCLTGWSAATPTLTLHAQAGRPGHHLVEFTFDMPQFIAGGEGAYAGQEVLLDGAGWIGQPGAPDLPSVQRLFEMPDHAGAQLRFVEGDSHIVGDVDLLPCQERMATPADLPLPWLRDAALYSRDAFWPEQVWQLGEPALMRNHRVTKASIFPVQVNPVTHEARVWTRMVFELSFEGVDETNARTFVINDPDSPLDRLARRQIVNPAAQGTPVEDLAFDIGRLPGKYLVFANSTAQANASFQALMNWKRKKGHHVVLVSQNDVSFTTTAIRNRIITEYQSADPVDYVLLVGDVDGDYALPTDDAAYDHFYAMIDGGDILGDVAVGRLSAGNSTQLMVECQKLLQYESTPYLANTQWLRRAGFTVGSSACGLSMQILSRSIAAELVSRRGYNMIDSAYCAGSSHVDDWFVNGISFYNYRGWVGMEGLDINSVLALAQGPRTPVATLFTCGTGDFNSGDDYTEAFLMAGNVQDNGGAVAALGFATLSTHTRYNNVVVGGYYNALLELDAPEVGACLLQGKYALYETLPPSEQGSAASFANWGNLMGDPGTPQWAGAPAALAVNTPNTLPLGANFLTLTVTSGGQPVEGVAVSAWQDLATDLQATGLSDSHGQVTLPLAGLQAGTLHITSTEHRHQPLLQQLTVSAGAANPALTSIGAGAGLLPGGGAQAVSLTIQNQGSAAMTGIGVTTSLDAAWGTVNNPGLSLASLAAGGSYTFTGLTISPVGSAPNGGLLPLVMSVTSNQGTFPLLARVPVAAPQLSAGSLSFPTGSLEPGASGSARLGVNNIGPLTGTGVTVTFVSDLPDLVSVGSGPISVGNLSSGGSVAVDINLSAAASANRGQPVPMHVDWSSQGGTISGSFPFLLTIGGNLVSTDPTGPDAYGYWAYENNDASFQAPVYSWYAISTPEGGSGTEIALSDDGDEQDDGAWVNLPFSFNYYGRAYARMAVCSNGFVAFDESGFGEWDFRNHHLPSGMGPDAMIAPMWDDHLTTGTTRGVWKYFDAAAHAFVISWYNLSANSSGGPNTFQLVLYDPAFYPTLTGDGPFKFQYQTFNDTQSNGADFPYCTLGFKDHSSTVGMTLRHWTLQPATMHGMAAGRAIYVSTPVGEVDDVLPPFVQVQALDPVYAGQAQTIRATISDISGLASVVLNWRVQDLNWSALPMTQGGTTWSATLPAQPGGTVVEFTITAVDASEHANTLTTELATFTTSMASLLATEGFNGTSTFSHAAGGGLVDEWHLETARAYEGTGSWKFGGAGTGDYSNSAGGVLSSPVYNLPAGCASIQAFIRSWIASETSPAFPDSCYDGGKVEWSLNGGAWTDAGVTPTCTKFLRWGTSGSTAALRAWLGFPRPLYSGVADWTGLTIAVPDGTTSLQLRWLFGTDTGVQREGWYLDDFRLSAQVPASPNNPVTDLHVSLAGGVLSLSWSAQPGAQAYRVYASSVGYDIDPVLVGQVSSPGYTEVVAGTRKYYTVRVVY